MAKNHAPLDLRNKLIDTATKLLDEQGPSAVQARSIAKEAGVSTMAVYSTFGGMPELLLAVAESGFRSLAAAFDAAPKTKDPVSDIFILAMVHRLVARQNPHLYDLMFGLSTRGAYRAIERDPPASSDAQPEAYQLMYAHLFKAAGRLVEAGRVRRGDPAVIAAQLWSFVHGFISLELGGHLVQFEDCVQQVMVPLGINMAVGLGDTPKRASKSIIAAGAAVSKL